jgi:myosin heavy subunit
MRPCCEVQYESDYFIEKNKDFVVQEHQALLGASTLELLVGIFQDKPEVDADKGGGREFTHPNTPLINP